MEFIQFCKMFFSQTINWVFIVAFVATFILYKYHFVKPLDARYKEIETYLDILKKYNPQNVNVYFESLSQVMENSDLIKGIWRKYQRTLISIPGKDGLEKYSTVESESYFSVAAFTEGMKGGLWSGLAGTFTGIGILGTFIGLTIGLAGVDTSSTGALSSSISGLLGGMSTAFVTSIFGIVSAIVFGVWHSQNMKRFGDAVSRFTDALDQVFIRKSVEEILLEELAESRAQRAAMEQLSTDMAISICDHLPDVLDQLAEKMDSAMKGNLDTMLAGLSERQDKQTEQLMQISSNTNSLVIGGFDQLGDVLKKGVGQGAEELGNSLKNLSSDIASLAEGIRDILDRSTKASSEANQKTLDALNEAISKMNETMEGMANKQTEETDKNIQRMTALMEEMKTTMKDIFDEMSASAKEQRTEIGKIAKDSADQTKENLGVINAGVKELMAESGGQMQQMQSIIGKFAIDSADQTKENLGVINASVKKLMAEIADQMQQMQSMMDTHEKHMQETLDQMRQAVSSSGNVVNAAGKTVEAAGKTAKVFVEAADDVSMKLKTAAEPLQKAAQPLQQAAASLDSGVQVLAQSMTKQQADAKSVAESMQKISGDYMESSLYVKSALEEARNSWTAYEKRFKGVSGELEKAFVQLDSGMQNYNKVTNEGLMAKLKKFDETISTAVDTLAGVTEEVNENIEDLTDAIKKMR
ncbi:MAG: MotA/TolQ/ExbB proton channel family protein [Dialister sp.]|nr:MotA/TolQ/ExbB proton channel family protein [Dialister sp.]MDY6115085.1 MotA/TolQ/ExbB proton channel family protein [Dialister sp.]